jgi:hypothetical protein
MVDETTNSNIDLNSLLKGVNMGNLLGGTGSESGGLGGGLLLGLLLGRTNLLGGGNGEVAGAAAITAERAAIDAAVASALASANQSNNNSMLLLKDIQDSSQEVISTVTNGNQNALVQQLQGQISNLQGQASILAGVEAAKGVVVNEVHESGSDVLASMNSLSTGILSNMNTLNTNVLQGFATTGTAITNDGDKTRAAIAALAASIPNARELDLQRQLAVALDDHRHTATRGLIDSGNTTVTTNVNQAQSQAQTQAQIQGINTTLATIVPYLQNIGQSVVNLGNMTASPTTATNVRA